MPHSYLKSQQRVDVPIPSTNTGNPIASDGTVYGRQLNPDGRSYTYGTFRDGVLKTIADPAGSRVQWLSDSGTKLINPTGIQPMPSDALRYDLVVRDLVRNEDLRIDTGRSGFRITGAVDEQ